MDYPHEDSTQRWNIIYRSPWDEEIESPSDIVEQNPLPIKYFNSSSDEEEKVDGEVGDLLHNFRGLTISEGDIGVAKGAKDNQGHTVGKPPIPSGGSIKKMAHNPDKQELPRFFGDGADDPSRHCRTCVTIWEANGITDEDVWLKAFLATLRGIAIDWYTDLPSSARTTWKDMKKAFEEGFRLLRDDDEVMAEIYNTKQGKHENVRAFYRRLKELMGKMDKEPADGLKKRWFIEGLNSFLRKQVKVVPPLTLNEAYNRAMNIKSETKHPKGRGASVMMRAAKRPEQYKH